MRPVTQCLLETVDNVPVTTLDIDSPDLSERALDGTPRAHGLHELERALPRKCRRGAASQQPRARSTKRVRVGRA